MEYLDIPDWMKKPALFWRSNVARILQSLQVCLTGIMTAMTL